MVILGYSFHLHLLSHSSTKIITKSTFLNSILAWLCRLVFVCVFGNSPDNSLLAAKLPHYIHYNCSGQSQINYNNGLERTKNDDSTLCWLNFCSRQSHKNFRSATQRFRFRPNFVQVRPRLTGDELRTRHESHNNKHRCETLG